MPLETWQKNTTSFHESQAWEQFDPAQKDETTAQKDDTEFQFSSYNKQHMPQANRGTEIIKLVAEHIQK